MPLNEALLDKYLSEVRAFEIKYPRGNAPKAEKEALDRLYIASINETPEILNAHLDAFNDTLGHVPALSMAVKWDGRKAA